MFALARETERKPVSAQPCRQEWAVGEIDGTTHVNVYLPAQNEFCLFESVVSGQFGSGFDFVEARGHVCRGLSFGADRVKVGGDVWRAVGGEGDVFVAGAFVDREGDEGRGGHWLFCC